MILDDTRGVYVIVRDRRTNKSKCHTSYTMTYKQALVQVRKLFSPKKRRKAS